MPIIGYIDANSGSLIASVVVAGAAGVAVWFKLGWHRATRALLPKRRQKTDAVVEAESDT
jgi:hypothetical protein